MNLFHRWLCNSALWRWALERKAMPWVFESAELGDHLLEVGAGPGLTTDWLRTRVPKVTALEIDPKLAASLINRFAGTNVHAVQGDGARMPFADATFSSAASLTMLHHVPSGELQDRLLAEVYRVLRPDGLFVGADSIGSPLFSLIHLGDTMVLVDPSTFQTRLEAVGFVDVAVDRVTRAFRFRARRD